MIYAHDFLTVPDVTIPGQGQFTISDLAPNRLREWAQKEAQCGQTPTQEAMAAQRRIRAWGLGSCSERWDPTANKYMPPGWIRNIQERKDTRHNLLRDINDLVSGCGCLSEWHNTDTDIIASL